MASLLLSSSPTAALPLPSVDVGLVVGCAFPVAIFWLLIAVVYVMALRSQPPQDFSLATARPSTTTKRADNDNPPYATFAAGPRSTRSVAFAVDDAELSDFPAMQDAAGAMSSTALLAGPRKGPVVEELTWSSAAAGHDRGEGYEGTLPPLAYLSPERNGGRAGPPHYGQVLSGSVMMADHVRCAGGRPPRHTSGNDASGGGFAPLSFPFLLSATPSSSSSSRGGQGWVGQSSSPSRWPPGGPANPLVSSIPTVHYADFRDHQEGPASPHLLL